MRTATVKDIEWKLDPTDHFNPNNEKAVFLKIVEALGFIPSFVSRHEGTLAERFNKAYSHGGGWSPFGQGEWQQSSEGVLQYGDPSKFEPLYPGDQPDPPMSPLVEARIGNEILRIYPHAWVSITQPDGSFEVMRMD